jgi:YNFM family putative membrane transporter
MLFFYVGGWGGITCTGFAFKHGGWNAVLLTCAGFLLVPLYASLAERKPHGSNRVLKNRA